MNNSCESLFGFSFGADVVVDAQGWVTISGIRYRNFQAFIQKYYNSPSFLAKFAKRSWTDSLMIHQFYVPELIFLLTKAVEERYLPPIQTKEIIDLLYQKTWMKDSKLDVPSQADLKAIENEFVPELKLKDYQLEFIRDIYTQKKVQYHLRGYLLSLFLGAGKMQRNGTAVRINQGWKNIEDIRVGDQVVAVDGTLSNVVGVYPQGMQDIYRVHFADGRYLDVGDRHLWTILVYDHDRINRDYTGTSYKEITLNTLELMDRLKVKEHSYRTFIPIATPEDRPDVDLPIEPYTLGVLLGDGSLSVTSICIHSDLEIINKVKAINGDSITLSVRDGKRNVDYYYVARICQNPDKSHPIRNALYDLGLIGRIAYDKFIPKIYLNASYKQRLALLQGLMDTDGYVTDPTKSIGHTGKCSKTGCVEYSTSSEQLAKDITELVCSLGGKCKVVSRIPYYTYKEQRLPGKTNYRLFAKLKCPDDMFTLERKRCRLAHESQYSKYWKLRVVSVEKLEERAECTCIAIDHPSKLYVAEDYIVTHNTVTSLALSTSLHKSHSVIICPLSTVKNVWVQEINKWYRKLQTIWTPDKDPLLINKDTNFVIANYEAIDKIAPQILKHYTPENTIFIIDECHNFKDVKALRTRQLYKLLSEFKSNDTLLVSGTPLKAWASEAIPIFKLLDDMFVPEIENDLYKLTRYTTVINDLFRNRLGLMMYRKLREEVLILPEKHEEELRIKIANGDYYTLENVKKIIVEFTVDRQKYYKEHYKEFETMYNKCLEEFEKTLVSRQDWLDYKQYKVNVLRIQKEGYSFAMMPIVVEVNKYEKEVIIPNLPVKMRADFRASKAVVKYVQLKILGEVLGGVLNTLRTEMTAELIGQEVLDIINNALKKTILFSSYTESIEIANNYCKKHGLKPVVITGENTKDAAQILSVFKRDPKLNPLIASIKAMSTGHTITEANTVIFLNVPFRSVDYEQASDRCYRIGQDSPVYIYKLILDTGDKPNLSTRMQDIIAWSKESFNAIVGDDSTEDTTANGILPTNTIKTITDQFNRLANGDTLDTFKSTIDNVLTTIKKFFK